MLADLYKALFKRVRGKGLGLGIFNRIHKFVWEDRLQPKWVDIDGMRLHLPLHDEGVADALRMDGTFEKEESAVFREKIKPGMTVLDVGANIGYYSVLASRLVGPQGKVLAFEPEPLNFELLIRNIVDNKCRNVTAWPYAVGTSLGFADLNLAWPASTGSHSIAIHPEGGSGHMRVVTVALDDFLEPSLWPDAMKMDIEGAELLALAGMEKILAHRKLKTIFIECVPEFLASMGKRKEDLTGLLARHGFQFQPIDRINILCTRA